MRELAKVRARRVVLVAVAVLLLVPVGVTFLPSHPARAASFTLYGDASRGWGPTSTSISSPGPTLIVTQGERVDLNLFAADSIAHTWCIDYNADRACALTGEEETPSFSSPTIPYPHTFTPTVAPGTYTYMCGIHGDFIMKGLIRIDPAPPPVRPVVTISSPAGTQRWTGGSTHDVVWTMTDPNDPVTSLRAWVNYTTGGPPNPIAGPILGSSNPHSVGWTLPLLNSTAAAVNVTVVDPAGNRGWAVQPVPEIDSSPPSVVGRVPMGGSTGISTATNVIVTFSEAMNRSATGDPITVAVQDLSTSTWVPVTYAWSGGDTVLTLDPFSNLSPTTMHWVLVNASAKDASDPGNGIATPDSWVFTTGSGADLAKPQIANVGATPSLAEYGTPVEVTATITDNDRVAAAFVDVTLPNSSQLNHSMALVSGTTWGWSQPYPLLGPYTFLVAAVDPSGNWNRSARGSFAIQDTTRPAILSVSVAPSPAEVYRPATIGSEVSDPFLLDVSIDVEGSNGTAVFNGTSGRWERSFTPAQVRTYAFTVWALDTSGNLNSRTGTMAVQDTTPPPMPTGLTATLVGGNAVELRWAGVSAPDLDGYRLYRSTSASGPFITQVGPSKVNGTAYVDRSVQPGATYYYVVSSVDTRGHVSMQSAAASATIPPPPFDYAPVIIVVAAGAVIVAALAVVLLLRRRRQKSA